MKMCSCCKLIKNTSEFHKNKRSKDGFKSQCKICRLKEAQEWYKQNTEKSKAYTIQWQKDNPEKSRLKHFEWRKNNLEKDKACTKKWQQNNPERTKEITKQWHKDNPNYVKNRRNQDPDFKLRSNLRSLGQRIKKFGGNKQLSTNEYLGASYEFVKNYLQSLFIEGMTWSNHSKLGWHIDHIIPLDAFDFTNIEQIKKACHYTNLMPLWYKDNLEKNVTVFKTKKDAKFWLEQRGYKLPPEFTYLE